MSRAAVFFRWGLFLLLAAASSLVVRNLSLRDNALDLLPEEVVQAEFAAIRSMGVVDRVFITLTVNGASDREAVRRLQESAEAVGQSLRASPLFREVSYRLPQGYEQAVLDTVWPHLPALLSPAEIESILPKLAPERLRSLLTEEFALLNSPAGIGLTSHLRRDPLGLARLLLDRVKNLRGEYAIELKDGFFFSHDGASCLLWADSAQPLTDSRHAQAAEEVLTRAFAEHLRDGVSARTIGTLPHTLANARTIQRDLKVLPGISLILLFGLLLFTLRDWRALLVNAVPLAAAPLAVALLLLAGAELSGLALGFGVVLLGIAVDYAIPLHVGLAREAGERQEIMRRLRFPLGLAYLTTVGEFVVLLFSQVPSHRQMAALSITGITLALMLSWLLVPDITVRRRHGVPLTPLRPARFSATLGFRGQAILVLLWLATATGGAWAWANLRYNGDLRTLDAPDQTVLADDAFFRSTWRFREDQTMLIARGKTAEEAIAANSLAFSRLRPVAEGPLQSLAPLLPPEATQRENLANWRAFWEKHGKALFENLGTIGGEIGFSPEAFAPFRDWLAAPAVPLTAEELLASPLRPLVLSMLHLPDGRKNGDNDFLVLGFVPDNPAVLAEIERIEREEPRVRAFSLARWRVEVEQSIRRDVTRLSWWAGLLVFAITALSYRRPAPVLAALAPVASALAAMALYSSASGTALNMMHTLMGIMVTGLSVDYGIFAVGLFEKGLSPASRLTISLCSLSTLIGFGALAFAGHPALHAIGVTVLCGIGLAWPTALWVSPAILGLAGRVRS